MLLALTYDMNVSCAAPSEPAAASPAFTSKDKTVLKARRLMDEGRFADAEKTLRDKVGKSPAGDVEARTQLLEIIRRTRLEYSMTLDALLRKVQADIPNTTAKDLDQWISEAKIRERRIDGQRFFFSGEPKNIYLFSSTAKARLHKAGKGKKASKWKLTDHMQAVVDEAEKTGQVEVIPVKHRFTHKLTIDPNLPQIKPGSVVRVWLPYPQEYRQQSDVKLLSASPTPKLIAPSAQEGNPVTGAPQRTIYFEKVVTNTAEALVFQEEVEFISHAYYPKLDPAAVKPLPADWKGAYLGERPPHIVFAPEIKKQVAAIVGKETNPLEKARKIFRWVSASIPWNSEDEYCIIPSFALKGFNARRGDCGVQNTVFVTMCRIVGVPARWQSGYETKPVKDDWGMHDWAEIYIAPWGWLPADASYGVKPSNDPRIADFYCGHQDSYRFIVNLDWGRELVPPKQSMRSEPADFQRGEVEVDGKNLYFDSWHTKTDVIREPVTPSL
ncbi:MAG: Transglutaminase-like superfamily protein [Verrucomicrobiales bacterium]|nr:Transglutaminase-like superfamily protein [Verrucomicrobiales bacterium]